MNGHFGNFSISVFLTIHCNNRYSLQKNQIEVRKSKAEKHIREWEEARCKK